jgi:predicted DsbA family dithiol-disulfide isomerase
MPTPLRTLRVDFVSDVVCPWCAIGLKALEAAAARVDGLQLELHFHPFELNPGMAPEGESIVEHLGRKYGAGPEQLARTQDAIRQRGDELGFAFNFEARSRIYNTRDAHRLLHWAAGLGGAAQRTLKLALLRAYFSDGRDVSDRKVLLDVVEVAGLDRAAAAEVLESGAFDAEVQASEHEVHRQGIQAVPAVVIDGRHLIQGGQPVEVFERVLRELSASAVA